MKIKESKFTNFFTSFSELLLNLTSIEEFLNLYKK